MQPRTRHHEALLHDKHLPLRLWTYLQSPGIAERAILQQLLGWNYYRITTPLFNRALRFTSVTLLKNRDDERARPLSEYLP
jgi:hypothetical protein